MTATATIIQFVPRPNSNRPPLTDPGDVIGFRHMLTTYNELIHEVVHAGDSGDENPPKVPA